MPKVYLETSFFSECCSIRAGDIARGRRATSLQWWKTEARRFELYISDEVLRELSSPDFPVSVRDPALAMLQGLPVLPISTDALGLAELLVRERVMPQPANSSDAIHLAMSLVYQIDYLLTWNQKHLANPNKRTHLVVISARLGYLSPEVVTPDLLFL